MVAFLQKPTGSEEFHEIVDFLADSHIGYALTTKPTIYVSLIKQFWQTVTVKIVNNGEQQLTVTVDGQTFAITKASVMRHLQLADADGISSLPNTKIFDQLTLMRYVSNNDKLTFQKGLLIFQSCFFDSMVKNVDSKTKILMYLRFIQLLLNKKQRLLHPYKRTYVAPSFSQKLFSNMKRGFSGVHIPLFSTMLVRDHPGQGDGSPSPGDTQHTPPIIVTSPQLQNISNNYKKTRKRTRRMGIRIPQSNVHLSIADEAINKEMYDGLVRATTTASSLEAKHGSGNIAKTQTKATPSGPSSLKTSLKGGLGEGNTSRSGEGSMQLLELMETCTKLSNRVTTLENELITTKAVYNKAFITLTKRVKKLETQLKKKRSKADIHSSDKEQPSLDAEDSPKQGRMIKEIDRDKNFNLVSEQRKTKSARKDKGKAKEAAMQEQEKYNLEQALELQKQLDKRKDDADKGDQAQIIDWNDPKVLRYHAQQNRAFSKAEVRKNMCTYLKNQGGYKMSYFKGMKYEDIRPIFERRLRVGLVISMRTCEGVGLACPRSDTPLVGQL
nr:hypothetical protein [Tanacetum cinerariifolium]